MTIDDIRKLVSNDETRQVELKKSTGELKDAMHSACAFLSVLTYIKEPHGSYPYNPLIAEVLYKTSYLESWGSGVKRIVDACRKQNVPDPEWSVRGGFVIVTFRRGIQTSNLTDNLTDNLTMIQKSILDVLGQNPRIGRNKVSEIVGISPEAVKIQLDRLKALGVIEHIGPAFGGYWKIDRNVVVSDDTGKEMSEK